MDWKALFANPPDHVALHYRTGSRRAPAGESLLVVTARGDATLDVWRGETHERFSKSLARAEAGTLFSLLGATGYPADEGRTVPPGAGMVAIEIVGVDGALPALLHRSYLSELAGWPALVARLDATCGVVSNGAATPGKSADLR